MATSGPGATNLITGITDAYMDSIPVVFITGQVPSSLIGRNAFQETDIIGITRPVVKHSYLVLDANDLPDIFAEAFLSFIGLGVQTGTPSWGSMISEVRERGGFFSNRHILLVPSVALVLTTLSFNFLGDGLRDALDPRMRGTQ